MSSSQIGEYSPHTKKKNRRMEEQPASYAARFGISRVVSNIDTIEIWTPILFRGVRRDLESTLGKRLRIRKARYGYVTVIHQPPMACLEYLAKRQHQFEDDKLFRLVVSRVDIGVDFHVPTPDLADRLREEIKRHLKLKWKRGPFQASEFETTAYWNDKRANRNIAVYSDRPARTASSVQSCCRLELRMTREAIRRQGLIQIDSIIEVNPYKLFNRNCSWIEWNQEGEDKLVNRIIRKSLPKLQPNSDPFLDRYVASFPNRARAQIKRGGIVWSLLVGKKSDSGGILSLTPTSVSFMDMI